MSQAIKIEFQDAEVKALLANLRTKTSNLSPLLKAIGEDLSDSTKRRFETGTGPDGRAWAPNTETTLLRYLGRTQGNFRKDGRLSKKGAARVGAKKPLTGESKALRTTIHYRVLGNTLEVGSPMEYSAVQQFGAKKGSLGKNAPWGDIPARPFIGISAEDRSGIEASVLDYLGLF